MYGKIDLNKISSLIQELKKEMELNGFQKSIFEDMVWSMVENLAFTAQKEMTKSEDKTLWDIHSKGMDYWIRLEKIMKIMESDKKMDRVIKMNESHRPKKEAGTWVGTLECEEKHETSRMKIIRFYLHTPEDEFCAKQITAQGGITKLKTELARIEARIDKRYIRAVKLEQERSEPVPISRLLKQLNWV
jgi:hypothetical protein